MCVCVCWYFMYRYVFSLPPLRFSVLSPQCAMFRPFYFPTRFHLQSLYSFALSHSLQCAVMANRSLPAVYRFSNSMKAKKKKRERFFYCFLLALSRVCWCWCVRSSRVDFLSIATAVFYATVKPINDFFFSQEGNFMRFLAWYGRGKKGAKIKRNSPISP